MSDSDNTISISTIFDPGFPEGLVDEPPPEASKVPVIASAGATSDPPSWDDIKQKQWSDIEARYEDGKRDKETVCAWMPYKAALGVCKGWPRGSFDELVLEGYQAAVRRWDAAYAPYVDPGTAPDEKSRKAIKKANALRYDPAKDIGNGIPGLVYTAAEGRMRNAAHELFTAHGKRKHKPDDVIPIVSAVADVERERRSPVTAPKDTRKAFAEVDYFTKADVGGFNDKAVNAAAKKAERTKFNYKWTTQAKVPTGSDRNANRGARYATEIDIGRLLSLLPNKEDRDIIRDAWGIQGVKKATIAELAKRLRCDESTVHNRLDKLLEELQFRSPRRPRQSAWRTRASAAYVAPLRGAA
jgi:hypothetical protein